MRRLLRWLGVTGAGSLLGAGGVVIWLLKAPEPSYSGVRLLPGLTGGVTVRFGPHAVPSIRANTIEDLLRAQGWVLASERLWQMDLMRRLPSGRLAEVFGAARAAA
jgi:penicillin amidase